MKFLAQPNTRRNNAHNPHAILHAYISPSIYINKQSAMCKTNNVGEWSGKRVNEKLPQADADNPRAAEFYNSPRVTRRLANTCPFSRRPFLI